MSQPFRLPVGGAIDRGRPLAFTFDGRPYQGYAGDTLASALLANGVRVVGRSFKYHRPRGIVGFGEEDPSALVDLLHGGAGDPNRRATTVALTDGLVARSQNCWPSLSFDLTAVIGLFAPLLPAGFYYKTFMAPASMWRRYERIIRRLAGLGRVPDAPGPERYERRFAHCDLLVAGGGPAGLAAACAAARTGARVILADDQPQFGGRVLLDGGEPDAAGARARVHAMVAELSAQANVRLLPATTVAGHYDHNFLTALQALAGDRPRQVLWRIRAAQVVHACGALERPIAFAGNDRPGVMLASAVRAYLHRHAVLCGRRAVVFTNNDSAWQSAFDLADGGAGVAAVVDLRERPPQALLDGAARRGIAVVTGAAVLATVGRAAIRAVLIGRPDGTQRRRIDCDLLCVSGGWNPQVQLFSQDRGPLHYDEALAAFRPARHPPNSRSVGAAAGRFATADCLRDGAAAGAALAAAAGFGAAPAEPQPPLGPQPGFDVTPCWVVPGAAAGNSFVDLQNDVTAADVALAAREGYRSVEHLKRYTTLGMGTDQGRFGNVLGLGLMAEACGRAIADAGTTTFRPPVAPLTLGAIVGGESEERSRPLRVTAADDWHGANGAVFTLSGLWRRPQFYRRPGESDLQAVNREVLSVRGAVGVVDVSTLGKIDLQGPDVAELLDRVYVNAWKNLAVGRARYGVMLREDGVVYDDGVTARLGERHYLMTVTTANADAVAERLEFLLQTAWRDLEVFVSPVTEQWFAAALAGPDARTVLARLSDGIDLANAAFPHMSVREGRVAGFPARVFRLSFSGELCYEINVPADCGAALWERLVAAGAGPYGTEAMGVMRIEKGHFVVGREADGRTLPGDLGIASMVSRGKTCIGSAALALPAASEAGRLRLVGLTTETAQERIPVGAHLVDEREGPPAGSLGHVTSMAFSPTVGRHIALALLRDGAARTGSVLRAVSPTAARSVRVRVVDPVFVDPDGERVRA